MVVGHAGGQSSLALLDYMVFTYVSLSFVSLYVAHRDLGAAKKTARIRLPPRPPRLRRPVRPVCLAPLPHRQARPRPQSIRPRTAQQRRRSRCPSPSPQLRYSVSPERSSSAQDDATSENTRNAPRPPLSMAAKPRVTVRRRPQLASASCLSSPARARPTSTHNKSRTPSSCPPPPLSPPSRSPSNATSYTWLPEAGAYVAVKPTAPAASVHSLASASQSRMDAELPPVPQSPQSPAGASSHEPTTLAGSGSGSGAQPAGRARGGSVLRYVQNDEGPEALSPLSEHSKAPLPSSPVSPSAGGSQHGSGPMTVLGTDMDMEEGPPPYAPRAPSRVGQQ